MTQAINFNNLIVNSDTAETLQIINNCVYGQLTCTISNCETSLHCGIAQDSNGMNVYSVENPNSAVKHEAMDFVGPEMHMF